MRILLVNDDGINAEGIQVLAKELEKKHEVIIVAPEEQQSAKSHSITITKPIIVKKVNLKGIKAESYSISGSPADCVRVAFDRLLDEPIDLVISGTNMGVNLGMDVLYSGTVSAAIEANIYNKPSIAISAEIKNGVGCYELAAKYAMKILDKVNHRFMESNTVLNINVPCIDEDLKGIKVCRIGGVIYDYYYVEEGSKEEEISLVISGRRKKEFEKDTDRHYVSKGYITVTPLQYDLTNFKLIEEVEGWLK